AMEMYDSAYFGLDADGTNDWAHSFPLGGHLVKLTKDEIFPNGTVNTPPKNLYSVTLFHQLRCLEIYHQEYLARIQGQSVKDFGARSSRIYTTVCRDWTQVYREAEKNFKWSGSFGET
ncbi:hypothetical protein GALMADRAFT_77275, partial [Galerina marginata CBS 339.88]